MGATIYNNLFTANAKFINMDYLSKSGFKQALSYPTKLYYGTRGNNYAENNADDPFMMALAEGGYQVGELAKFLVCNDQVGENITINEFDA